jgi:hypothetical protein
MNWTQSEAIELCRKIEAVCPKHGCHVALTGGLLYKDGERKDCDLLFYRIRQAKEIDKAGLFTALQEFGVVEYQGFGWCHKARTKSQTEEGAKELDLFFPEEDGDEPIYEPGIL